MLTFGVKISIITKKFIEGEMGLNYRLMSSFGEPFPVVVSEFKLLKFRA